MGQEVSFGSTNYAFQSPADIVIPTSLRPIHPFLEDAQRNLWCDNNCFFLMSKVNLFIFAFYEYFVVVMLKKLVMM